MSGVQFCDVEINLFEKSDCPCRDVWCGSLRYINAETKQARSYTEEVHEETVLSERMGKVKSVCVGRRKRCERNDE